MPNFLERHAGNAILAALITSALSFVGAGLSAYFTYHGQDRQVKIEQVSRFDIASNNLSAAAGIFIAAINSGKMPDIDAARMKVNGVIAGEMQQSETLRKAFDGGVTSLIDEYQTALTQFNQVAENTQSVIQMRPWAESFGRVLDLRIALSNAMSRQLGLAASKSGA